MGVQRSGESKGRPVASVPPGSFLLAGMCASIGAALDLALPNGRAGLPLPPTEGLLSSEYR